MQDHKQHSPFFFRAVRGYHQDTVLHLDGDDWKGMGSFHLGLHRWCRNICRMLNVQTAVPTRIIVPTLMVRLFHARVFDSSPDAFVRDQCLQEKQNNDECEMTRQGSHPAEFSLKNAETMPPLRVAPGIARLGVGSCCSFPRSRRNISTFCAVLRMQSSS